MATTLDVVRTELSAAMAAVSPGLEAANELCAACVGLFGVDGAAVSLVYRGASRGTFGASNESSRRLDEYQFTYGEGPCLDAVTAREAVLVPDLDSPQERRWPGFAGALLDDGVRAVFALPIMVTSVSVGALDLFRAGAGPLQPDQLAGAQVAARLAAAPLLELIASHDPEVDRGSPSPRDGAERPGPAELDRVEVYQATGMLIAQLDVDATDALLRLRAHAIATDQTASQVAWAIVERRLLLARDDQDGTPRTTP